MTTTMRDERGDVDRDRRARALVRIATARTEARIPPLVDQLERAGVPVLVLKGPVTRQRLYGPGEVRATADVDLLVAPGAFRRASRTLTASGHRRVRCGGHADTFLGDHGYLDLHLALPFATVVPRGAFAVLWERSDRLLVGEREVPVLDVPSHVVHLALHTAQNRFDPNHRSMAEWRRGHEGLSERDRRAAERVADDLGARSTWDLAVAAIDDPSRGARLATELAVRWPRFTPSGLWAFGRSPIPVHLKWRAIRARVLRRFSGEVLRAWIDRRRGRGGAS